MVMFETFHLHLYTHTRGIDHLSFRLHTGMEGPKSITNYGWSGLDHSNPTTLWHLGDEYEPRLQKGRKAQQAFSAQHRRWTIARVATSFSQAVGHQSHLYLAALPWCGKGWKISMHRAHRRQSTRRIRSDPRIYRPWPQTNVARVSLTGWFSCPCTR